MKALGNARPSPLDQRAKACEHLQLDRVESRQHNYPAINDTVGAQPTMPSEVEDATRFVAGSENDANVQTYGASREADRTSTTSVRMVEKNVLGHLRDARRAAVRSAPSDRERTASVRSRKPARSRSDSLAVR